MTERAPLDTDQQRHAGDQIITGEDNCAMRSTPASNERDRHYETAQFSHP